MTPDQVVIAFQRMITALENAGFANDEALHQLAASLLLVQLFASLSLPS